MRGVEGKADGSHILSEEELRALTGGMESAGGAVLLISPRAGDREILGRTLRDLGYDVLCAGKIPADLDAESLKGAVVAEEVLARDERIVERLLELKPELSVFVVRDEVSPSPLEPDPRYGLWARESLGELAKAHFGSLLSRSVEEPSSEPPPPSPGSAGFESASPPVSFLEALCAPAEGISELVERALFFLLRDEGALAAGVAVWEEDFLLRVQASSSELRRKAGRWILESGEAITALDRPARFRPDGFGTAYVVPLSWGEKRLGALFYFWRERSRLPQWPGAVAASTLAECYAGAASVATTSRMTFPTTRASSPSS